LRILILITAVQSLGIKNKVLASMAAMGPISTDGIAGFSEQKLLSFVA
jgi:hypothetical protein